MTPTFRARHEIYPPWLAQGTCGVVNETTEAITWCLLSYYEYNQHRDLPAPFSLWFKPRMYKAVLGLCTRIHNIFDMLNKEDITIRPAWFYWGPGQAGINALVVGVRWYGLEELI